MTWPGSGVPVRTKLAAENRLPNIVLNLENNRATLRFTAEVENEAGIRFWAEQYMYPSRVIPQLHPTILEHCGPGQSSLQVYTDVEPAQ